MENKMDKQTQEFYDRALKLHNGDEKALYEYLQKVKNNLEKKLFLVKK
jgi:hypothetical protein